MREKIGRAWRRIVWSWSPRSDREASESVVRNFWLHWFPSRVSHRSMSWGYSFWLGTFSGCLFVILALTGILLLFFYVPSVQNAYWSIKDLDNVVEFGGLLRSQHRWAAQLMVGATFLHLVRIFLTGSYRGRRVWNWYIGIGLLVVTLFLSFSGYLLPWDQLAYWALTIGTAIASALPVVGKSIRFVLIGGNAIGQSSLLRFYGLHNFVLPAALLFLFALHMWRIRKDGGLACVDNLILEDKSKAISSSPTKTYSLLGITEGTSVQVTTTAVLDKENSTHTSPHLVRRIAVVLLFTTIATLFLAVLFPAPLEEAANPAITPIPAKAPWYFLWLQELIAVTTIKIGKISISGGLIGGILIPGFLFLLAVVWPILDKSPQESVGVWFHKSRKIQNTIFLLLCLAIVVLIIIGVYLRGPYWNFYWPWQSWPEIPKII